MMRLLRNLVVLMAGFFAAGRMLRPRRKPLDSGGRAESSRWKTFFKRLAALAPLLLLLGFLVAASGIVSIKASSGHWAITEWLLNFSMSRSVATHSLGVDVPDLNDPALVMKGAGHFETGCRPCHGGVRSELPMVSRKMTPFPPPLAPQIPKWKPRELFYIVKHGVKFTGMPAWPSQQRDDEVWAVVAFLRRLPDLDTNAYGRLVFGSMPTIESTSGDTSATPDIEAIEGPPIRGLPSSRVIPELVVESCGRCHGRGGSGRETSAFPRLAGQRAQYLYAQLTAYADGERHSGIMQPIAAGLRAEEIRELAIYYAGVDQVESTAIGRIESPDSTDRAADKSAAIERGREIAARGIPAQRVPSCSECHGPHRTRRNPFFPNLAGQYADYLILQLELFKEGRRGGSSYAHLMRPTAPRLTEDQMRDVALYYESLRP